ncbi:hypothetical protein B0H66DRAFT_569792 [Apodospora peruviana]|uniref:Kelch repeat protein n=1 Tax=Apodospora peruviana TaxID=516989 RepID=A0AAE0LZB5_9PEZI|nr:hypothetical protein B0H66DRAFT_569792 [Apodospora peruviana]
MYVGSPFCKYSASFLAAHRVPSAKSMARTRPWLVTFTLLAVVFFMPVSLVVQAVDDHDTIPDHNFLSKRNDAPPTDDFLRHVWPTVIVIGDYLYIDGGEVSQLYDGNNGMGAPSYAMNGTLSISLKESWTNSSVTIREIAKPAAAPVLNRPALWRDPSGMGFYTLNGVTYMFGQPPPSSIWKFTADGAGGGSWAEEAPRGSAVVALSQFTRSVSGAWAQSRDVGYYVSGLANKQTDTSVVGSTQLALPGVIAFNMTSGELTNSSSIGLGPYGTRVSGAADFVPFGPSGLLLFLGGWTSRVAEARADRLWVDVDFNNLTLYDPSSKKWYSQPTTGARPTRRRDFCTVGVQGPNNTYEIFMYGGAEVENRESSDEVYVLSLPGFVFFQGPGSNARRSGLSCALVGRRQMLSVGGCDGYLPYPDSLLDPDPWKNGLGVFDLSDMAWRDRYDADAAAYESPAVVRDWYAQDGLASVQWSSNEVGNLFNQKAAPSDSSNPSSSGGGGGEPFPTSSTPTSEPSPTGSPMPVGAIVGGVIGGLAFLILVNIAIFLLRKRGRAANKAAGSARDSDSSQDESKAQSVVYLNQGQPEEMGAWETVEMPASHGFSELDPQETTRHLRQ